MFCVKCGTKLNDNNSSCYNCKNNENLLNNNYLEIKNKKIVEKKKSSFPTISLISLIIFSVVIILNLIFFAMVETMDPTGAGQAAAWLYIFFGLPISIYMIGTSFILAIVSICTYFKEKKIQSNFIKKNYILFIFNVTQIVLILGFVTIFFLFALIN